MALTYTLSGSAFTDSQYGSAANATAVKMLVKEVVDERFHKQVLKKQIFATRGLIGPDGYREGDTTQTAPGFPIIRKEQLNSSSGDVIKMGLLRKLTADHKTGGKVLNAQLVDAEGTYDFYNNRVSIERWRHGVYGFGGMSVQRNPYATPIKGIQETVLQDWAADIKDTSILYAQWCGWSPNLLRAHGHTNCAPTANVNTLFGNDVTLDTARTIANISGSNSDNVSGLTLEIGSTYMQQNDFDPVMVDGQPYWVALVSPKGRLCLQRDEAFREAMQLARERGKDNPLFRWADAIYADCVVFSYDKIRSILGGLNPAGSTVGSSEITEASYTGIGDGVTAAQLHQTMFLGANATAFALGMTSIVDRKEDDYGNIIGTGVDMIFGAKRCDWAPESGSAVNQSGLVIVNTVLL
jgi:hypothetical protein